MPSVTNAFTPCAPLLAGQADPRCRACVVVPARNEAASLGIILDRLAAQRTETGQKLAAESFEILLLLNNCTDDSLAVARAAAHRHSTLRLHLVERKLPGATAHVGTARRLLMDTAWHRLQHQPHGAAILSTDADTLVAPDWIAQNLRALANGADAVGGEICWIEGELAKLAPGVQLAYTHDLHYQRLLAELEHLLDPRPEDPLPRHLHHFGASLACTPAAYANAGGLPALRSLEDVALVHALERTGARLRHEPRVRVFTSGRLDGRVEVGLSGQLRTWQEMCALGEPHMVPAAAWSVHRLRTMHSLRCFAQGVPSVPATLFPIAWRARLLALQQHTSHSAEFLALLPADAIIDSSFHGDRCAEILVTSRKIEAILRPQRARTRDASLPHQLPGSLALAANQPGEQ